MATRYTSSFGGSGGQQGCDQLDEWCGSQGDEHAVPVRGVVDQICAMVRVALSGRELMRMIDL